MASVPGRVDPANAEPFKPALWPLLEGCAQGGDRLLLDLAGLDYIEGSSKVMPTDPSAPVTIRLRDFR